MDPTVDGLLNGWVCDLLDKSWSCWEVVKDSNEAGD